MKRTILFLGVLLSIFLCNSHVSAGKMYYKTINLDAIENCTSTTGETGDADFEYRAVKIVLPAGKYVFEFVSGAISKWPDAATAHSQNREPWLCFAQIAADGVTTIVGRDWGYVDKKTALEKNKKRRGKLNLSKSTTVYVWIEDTWQGVDYCDDNRGTLEIGIIKIQ